MLSKSYLIIIFTLVILIIHTSIAVSIETTSSGNTIKSTGTQIIAPERRNIPGNRFSLSTGQLFIPDYYRAPKNGKTDLILFFHGASWCAEQNFYDSRQNAVFYSVTLKDYQDYFQETTRFAHMIDEIFLTLETAKMIKNPKLNKLCLSSFSGGYSAIREILKTDDYYTRVTDLILADSLYCGFTDTTRRYLNEDQMAPFLRFAKDAAHGEKTMWYTHLYPPEEKYRDNTTTRTAEYLIEKINISKKDEDQINAMGMQLLYSAQTGRLHILGYAGMTNQDHFNHLYNMAEYLRKISEGWTENSKKK